MTTSVEEARAALRAKFGDRLPRRAGGLSRKQVFATAAAPSAPENVEQARSAMHKLGGADANGGDVIFFRKNGERVMVFERPKISIAPKVGAAFIAGTFSEKPEEEYNTDKQLMEIFQRLSVPRAAAEQTATAEEVPELVPEDFEKTAAAAEALD